MSGNHNDPLTHFLDPETYQFISEHNAFFHCQTKFWYVPDYKLFWSQDELQWYTFENEDWLQVTAPTNLRTGPWKPGMPSRNSRVLEVAALLYDLRTEVALVHDKGAKLSYLVEKIRERFGVTSEEAKQLYNEARKQFKSRGPNNSRVQAPTNLSSHHNLQQQQPYGSKLPQQQPQVKTRPRAHSMQNHSNPRHSHPHSHTKTPPMIPKLKALEGTWSDVKQTQFWHLKEVDGFVIGVGIWVGFEHNDCCLRGFRKSTGEITVSIDYSFRKNKDMYAQSHVTFWTGMQEENQTLVLSNAQTPDRLKLTKMHQDLSTTEIESKKRVLEKQMKELMSVVKSNTASLHNVRNAVAQLKILQVPTDRWVIEQWRARAQQAISELGKGLDLCYLCFGVKEQSKFRIQTSKFQEQIDKGIITLRPPRCNICALEFSSRREIDRLKFHALHNRTHQILAQPLTKYHSTPSIIKGVPHISTKFGGTCMFCDQAGLRKNRIFIHVNDEKHLQKVIQFNKNPRIKDTHKADVPKKIPVKVAAKEKKPDISKAANIRKFGKDVKNEFKLEILFHVRSDQASRRRSNGVSLSRMLRELQKEFNEIENFTQDDLFSIIEEIPTICVNSSKKVVYRKRHFSSADDLCEKIAKKLLKEYPTANQKQVEWRGVSCKSLYRDREILEACNRHNIRGEFRLKEYVQKTSLPGLHVERDTDQRKVKDFTVWVRFEQTRRLKNWKKDKLESTTRDIKKRVKSAAECKQAFRAFTETSMVSKDRIMLKDPFTYKRIQTPAKAKGCTHTQCFDLETFLRMKLFQRDICKTSGDKHIKIDRWTCPQCDGPAGKKTLYVDGFWQEILNNPQTKDADHVFIFPDCTYKVQEIELQEQSDSDSEMGERTVTKPAAIMPVISLLSDDEDEPAAAKKPPPQNKPNETFKNQGTKRKSDTENDERKKLKKTNDNEARDVSLKMDREMNRKLLHKLLQNIRLENYGAALATKKIGLLELFEYIIKDDYNHMGALRTVIPNLKDRLKLFRYIRCVLSDHNALLHMIFEENAPNLSKTYLKFIEVN